MPPQPGALSAAQLDAVTHPGGPLLVVAGAGAGVEKRLGTMTLSFFETRAAA